MNQIASNANTIQKYDYIAGTVFLLLSAGFVVLNMDHGIWYDEIYTLHYANPNFSFFDNLNNRDGFTYGDLHPPFYTLVIYLWSQVFPFTEVWVRIFGLIAYAAIMATCFFLSPSDTRRVVFRFIVMVSSSIFILQYMMEIRSYVLMSGFASLVALCVFQLTQDETETSAREFHKILLAVSLGLLSGTHLWGAILAGAVFVSSISYLDLKKDRNFYYYTIAAFLLASPFILYLLYITFSGGRLLETANAVYIGSDIVGLKLIGTMLHDFQHALFVAYRSKIIFGVVFVLMMVTGGYASMGRARHLLYPVIISVGSAAIASWFLGSFYAQRTMIGFVPFIFMFLAILASDKTIRREISTMLFIGFVVANFGSVPFFDTLPKKPYNMIVVDGEISQISNPAYKKASGN